MDQIILRLLFKAPGGSSFSSRDPYSSAKPLSVECVAALAWG